MSAGRSRPYLSMSYRGVRRNSNGRFDIKKRPVLEVEHIGNYIARKRFSQVSIVANIAVDARSLINSLRLESSSIVLRYFSIPKTA
jgi:hypothetical protein